ncbi:MAG: hypothetical protein OHK0046_29950 [Anaerolineae bacterium]
MSRLTRLMIEAMAKHLPPSTAQLRLLDVNGETGAVLTELRQDVEVQAVPGQGWENVPPESVDAVVAYDYVLNDAFLSRAQSALRPGGRLIVVNSRGEVSEAIGQRLEDSGYTRILVETAVECPLPTGVLMRGEKPHTTDDTLARIQQVAGQEANMLDLASYKGRYVHLLVVETPNVPVWRRVEGTVIQWQAAALTIAGETVLLAFSSLPKAVSFMQPAVLANRIQDVNKVGKFSREAAQHWPQRVLLNPELHVLDGATVAFIPVDATTAETPDE